MVLPDMSCRWVYLRVVLLWTQSRIQYKPIRHFICMKEQNNKRHWERSTQMMGTEPKQTSLHCAGLSTVNEPGVLLALEDSEALYEGPVSLDPTAYSTQKRTRVTKVRMPRAWVMANHSLKTKVCIGASASPHRMESTLCHLGLWWPIQSFWHLGKQPCML